MLDALICEEQHNRWLWDSEDQTGVVRYAYTVGQIECTLTSDLKLYFTNL